jgi:hypothetical protein
MTVFLTGWANMICWLGDRLWDKQIRDDLADANRTIVALRAECNRLEAENVGLRQAVRCADLLLGLPEMNL